MLILQSSYNIIVKDNWTTLLFYGPPSFTNFQTLRWHPSIEEIRARAESGESIVKTNFGFNYNEAIVIQENYFKWLHMFLLFVYFFC